MSLLRGDALCVDRTRMPVSPLAQNAIHMNQRAHTHARYQMLAGPAAEH